MNTPRTDNVWCQLTTGHRYWYRKPIYHFISVVLQAHGSHWGIFQEPDCTELVPLYGSFQTHNRPKPLLHKPTSSLQALFASMSGTMLLWASGLWEIAHTASGSTCEDWIHRQRLTPKTYRNLWVGAVGTNHCLAGTGTVLSIRRKFYCSCVVGNATNGEYGGTKMRSFTVHWREYDQCGGYVVRLR